MPTIYICGSDIPENNSKGLVDTDKIKAKLKSLKCAVVNPIEMPFAKMSWTDKLDNRVQLLKKSQGGLCSAQLERKHHVTNRADRCDGLKSWKPFFTQ